MEPAQCIYTCICCVFEIQQEIEVKDVLGKLEGGDGRASQAIVVHTYKVKQKFDLRIQNKTEYNLV